MQIGLFFGSFNPPHVGHLALANYIVAYSGLDEIWFVLSPQNPFKPKSSLLNNYDRYELLRRAIGDADMFRISTIEFDMPRPSYTIDTLVYLNEKYSNHAFNLIMGADNLHTFNRWKNYEQILEHYQLMVYPRPGYDGGDLAEHNQVRFIDAPQMEISSNFIRKAIAAGKDVRFFVAPAVWEHIMEMQYYH